MQATAKLTVEIEMPVEFDMYLSPNAPSFDEEAEEEAQGTAEELLRKLARENDFEIEIGDVDITLIDPRED